MTHDTDNTMCDLNMHPGAAEVLCTCDDEDDRAADRRARPLSADMPRPRPRQTTSASITLTGASAAALEEYREAAREMDAARQMVAAAQERFRAALDRFTAEVIR